MFELGTTRAKQAHVVVCGNEKGGSGKTTTAMHILVSLLNSGYNVASVDLDSRQLSLTRYVENRVRIQRKTGMKLVMPNHFHLDQAKSDTIAERENEDLGRFSEILNQVDTTHDFVLIDTPGHDGYLMRLAHSMADTLITPLNDSFVDFDVLGRIDPETGDVTNVSHYAQMVRDARRHRRKVDNGLLDWIVVRNRLSHINSRNKEAMLGSLKDLSMRLGCRLAEGISERVIFRELFPIGLTALDDLTELLPDTTPTLSHLSARQEVRQLIGTLKLPIDELGKKRAAARKSWLESSGKPFHDLGVLAD